MSDSRRNALVLVLALSLAACGGKQAGTSPSGGSSEGDDAATPFNDARVKAAIGNTPGDPACGIDASTTMGAHLEAQRAMLTGGDASVIITESFTCRAQADDTWECQWGVFTAATAPSPDDPCAGEGGSGYIIMAIVANNGTIQPGSINCNAPG
jgi:hypothetical protein